MNIQQEIEALQENLLATEKNLTGNIASFSLRYITLKQIGGLNGLIRMGSVNKGRKMRIAILKMWAGEPMRRLANIEFASSKNLTGDVASFLINLLRIPDSKPWKLTQYGKDLIRETEKLVNKEWGLEQLEIEI